jgi:hypothetical protein
MRWQNWHNNSPNWLDMGGSPQRQVLDSATQPNRSIVEVIRRRLGDSSTYRISIVDMPIIVPPYCTSRSLYSLFSARICLESQVALGASLILYAFESAFYCVLVGTTVYKKNIYIETGIYDTLLRWSSWVSGS